MPAQVPQIPIVFGLGRLDSLDRQILEVICEHGREGQNFNRLVTEARPFASRSTFALRTKRLVKLNYVERFPDAKNRQIKRFRGTPTMLLLAESIKERKALGEEEINREVEFANQINDRIKGVYSLVGVYAVNLGEAVAGDLILPMVVEDFRRVNSALASLLASNPKLTHTMADKKLAGVPMDRLRDDFRYAFGTEMEKALPRFSRHLKKLSKAAAQSGHG